MRLIAVTVSLLLSPAVFAWQTPRQAVDEYLKFELNCGRCETWPFEKYIVVDADYDEPGWDMIHLIKSAKIISFSCQQERCTARVKFIFTPTARLPYYQIEAHPKGGNQVVTYTAVRHKGEWLLESEGPGAPLVLYSVFKRRFPNGL